MLHAHVHWGARILYPRVLCTRAIYPRRFVHSFARIHKREAFVEPCKSSARCTNTGARSTFARTRTLFSPSSFPRSLSSFNRTTQPRRVSRSPSPLFNSPPPPAHAASLSFSLSLSLSIARARASSFRLPLYCSLVSFAYCRICSGSLAHTGPHLPTVLSPSSPSCTYLRPWPSCVHAYLPSLSLVYTRELSLSLLHEQIRIPRARERT
jgi:hypothetical protein